MRAKIEPSGASFLQGYQEAKARSSRASETELNVEAMKLLAKEGRAPVEAFVRLLNVGEDRANRILGVLLERNLAHLDVGSGSLAVTLTVKGRELATQFGWNQ
jgi:predicted transcriptional regulator